MDKQIASVYETYDYDKFHIMKKGIGKLTITRRLQLK